jgi:methyl-accepting chemotaxis protein
MNQLSRTGIFRSGRSFRLQMLLSVAGIFFLLVLSAGYILLSGKHLELIAERGFSRERFIKTIQAGLDAAQQPLQEYLSAASPQALTRIRLISRELREKLPAPSPAARPAVPGEAQLFSLIGAYLDLMDQALAEKEAGTIAAYTGTYNEMRQLFQYIGAELDAVFIEQFHRQVETFEHFIVQSAALQFWNLLFIICVSAFAILLLLRSVGRITTPLVQLSTMTAELSAGNFNVADIKTGYNQEMDRVVEAFNRMKNEMRTYIEKLRRQEAITQEYMQEKCGTSKWKV